MNLNAYFDGAYGHGVAAYGFVIKNAGTEVVEFKSGHVGRGHKMSCNVAEFEGLYQAMLLVAQKYPEATVEFNGDSSLVIALMRGEAKARSGKYIPYYEKAAALAAPFIEKRLWKFRWIQRSFNSEADELAQYHRF